MTIAGVDLVGASVGPVEGAGVDSVGTGVGFLDIGLVEGSRVVGG